MMDSIDKTHAILHTNKKGNSPSCLNIVSNKITNLHYFIPDCFS
jgi:hypothetical protein